MAGWRCDNCNYLHIPSNLYERIPSRCPVCGSRRLKMVNDEPTHPNLSEYIKRLSRLKTLEASEGEEER
ncbi:MAG: hypothetical protein QXG63_03800, partial [Nitrososphaerales archaeon]